MTALKYSVETVHASEIPGVMEHEMFELPLERKEENKLLPLQGLRSSARR